jgi:hypothetical protein
VHLHRARREVGLACDHLAGLAFDQQGRDLAFARRQRRRERALFADVLEGPDAGPKRRRRVEGRPRGPDASARR